MKATSLKILVSVKQLSFDATFPKDSTVYLHQSVRLFSSSTSQTVRTYFQMGLLGLFMQRNLKVSYHP